MSVTFLGPRYAHQSSALEYSPNPTLEIFLKKKLYAMIDLGRAY